MATYSTIYEFQQNHPLADKAYQVVCVSPIGEIHQHIFSIDDWHNEIRNIMTSYVYINGWFVHTHEISIVKP